jgi:hypothetical protein
MFAKNSGEEVHSKKRGKGKNTWAVQGLVSTAVTGRAGLLRSVMEGWGAGEETVPSSAGRGETLNIVE